MLAQESLLARLFAIGAIGGVMLLITVVSVPVLRELREVPRHPPAAPMASPGEPIRSEALPYRTRPGMLAVRPDAEPRPEAQPRTLGIYRSLRAYPGAPPRIPHGLTDREFLESRCNSCHARGGFTPRFGAYAPVTPHPEYADCLQCHAPDAMTVGLAIPVITADAICSQCHVDPDAPPPSLVSLEWTPRPWPELGQRAMEGSPQWIPHDLHLREDCLACHGGPAAVPELRTTHPERVDCRSCHVPAGAASPSMPWEEEVFTRPLDRARSGAEGRGS